MKNCIPCGATLGPHNWPDYLREAHVNKCIDCRAEYQRQWREANAERLKANRRARYLANREAILADNRRWRQQNPEKNLASIYAWNERNPEKVADYRAKSAERAKAKRRAKD